MNKEFLCDAIGSIDEKYIDEATDEKAEKISKAHFLRKWQKAAALAACLVFATGALIAAPKMIGKKQMALSPGSTASSADTPAVSDSGEDASGVGNPHAAASPGPAESFRTAETTGSASTKTAPSSPKTSPTADQYSPQPKETSVSTITRNNVPFTVTVNGKATYDPSCTYISEANCLNWLSTLECYQNQDVSTLQILRGHKVNTTSYYGEAASADGKTKVISFSVTEIYIDEVLKENNSSGYGAGNIVKIYEDYAIKDGGASENYYYFPGNRIVSKPLDNGEYVFLLSYNAKAFSDQKAYFGDELSGVWQYIASCTPEFYAEQNRELIEYHQKYGNIIN